MDMSSHPSFKAIQVNDTIQLKKGGRGMYRFYTKSKVLFRFQKNYKITSRQDIYSLDCGVVFN